VSIYPSGRVLAPWIAGIAFFAVWELVCRLFEIDEFILPSPSASFAALWQYWDGVWLNAGQTLYTTLLGFAPGGGLWLGVGRGGGSLAASVYRALSAADRV